MSLRCLVGLLLASAWSSTPLFADCGPVSQWIWSSELPLAGEQVELQRTFVVRPGLAGAELSGLADDELVVLIDGRSVLTATQWSRWTTAAVEGLTAGEHRIVGRASNLNGYAGCAIRLRLTYQDGSVEVVTTDPTWRSATGPAVSHGLVGSSPWGDPAGEAGDYYQWKDALGAGRPNRRLRSGCCPVSRSSWSVRPSRGRVRGSA